MGASFSMSLIEFIKIDKQIKNNPDVLSDNDKKIDVVIQSDSTPEIE